MTNTRPLTTTGDLTDNQVKVIAVLKREPMPLTVAEIRKWAGVPSASNVLASLAKKNIVERNPNGYWFLTDSGEGELR